MSNSEDKFNTNVPVDPLMRLASFKPPRDLSLGGLKPNKKIFTPNLNVARKKHNSVTPSNSKVVKKEEKNKKDRKSDKNKNFKNGPKVIKSTGVFSEGLGSVERHTHSRVSYGRDSEPAQALQKPTIKMENIVKIDYDDEEQKIREAYGDEWYDAECENFSDEEAPIKLPPNGSWLNTEKKPGVIKQEVIVKPEPRDYDDGDHRGDDNHHRDKGDGDFEDVKPVSIGKMFVKQTDVTDLLKNDKPTLIFLQLPDILPGRGGDDDFRRKHDESSTSEADDKPKDNRCRMKDLQEGKIGTMRVHRSGKVTMYIGDTLYEVSTGIRPSFHQELVSTTVDDASRSANLISLGDLQNKLVITPHWESIFDKMSM